MKTIKERLMELPDGYRELAIKNTENHELAIENIDESDIDDSDVGFKINSLSDAIFYGFVWRKAPEGGIFRRDVHNHYDYLTPLPPLPKLKREDFPNIPYDKPKKYEQPKMRLNNGLEYPVASLVWMDDGKTLRAFPEKKLKRGEIKSYVIYTENPEESEVGAVLVC